MDTRKVQDAIRLHILDSQDVVDVVSDRVYPQELARVHTPVYPCINFIITPGAPMSMVKDAGIMFATVWGWATGGYDDAGNALKLVESQLANTRIGTDECYISINVAQFMMQIYDEKASVYGYVMRYRLMAIER